MKKKETKKTKESISKVERKNEKSKFWNKLDNILDKAKNYFFYPFVLLVGLTLLGQYYKQTTFGFIIDVALTAMFFTWIGVCIYKLIRKTTKIAIIWPLIISLVSLISSFITSFANQTFASDISFIVGMFFMEVFLIYLIVYDVYSKKNRISRVIISSVLFVVLGYITIFYSSYGLEDNTIFNSLIDIFSAIVGGGLTLGGVAWTIKHEKEEKKLEEKLKAKPVVFICDFNNLNHTLEKPLQKYMISNNNYGTLKRADEKHVSYSIPQIIISNSDYSCVSVRGFRINNGYHIYDYGQVLSKNALIEMVGTYSFRYDNTIEYVSLILQDMLNNVYELEVNFEIYGNDKNKGIKILSGIEIKESDLVF